MQGFISLRETFAESLERDHNITISPDQVVVSVGAMGALFNTFSALIAKDDEVLIPDPGYPNYIMALNLLHSKPVPYPLGVNQNGFYIDTDIIKSLITEKTKAIVINSPSNPTGLIANEESVLQIIEIASQAGIYIISDESYDHIIFDQPHISPLSYDLNGQIISIYSCSKTYAMTGWRVGFAVAPSNIIQLISKLQEATVSCASSVSQKAAEAALKGPQNCVEEMRIAYQKNRDIAINMCEQMSLQYTKPNGAFYLMISLPSSACHDSMQFSLNLLRMMKLAVAPGITFGRKGEGYIRLALCVNEKTIIEGLNRISSFYKNGIGTQYPQVD